MNESILMAHAGHAHHAVHWAFAIFCVLVVVFCIAAAKWTKPKAPVRH